MAYKVYYDTSFEKDVKGFKKNRQALIDIQDQVKSILDNPTVGENPLAIVRNTALFTGYINAVIQIKKIVKFVRLYTMMMSLLKNVRA